MSPERVFNGKKCSSILFLKSQIEILHLVVGNKPLVGIKIKVKYNQHFSF